MARGTFPTAVGMLSSVVLSAVCAAAAGPPLDLNATFGTDDVDGDAPRGGSAARRHHRRSRDVLGYGFEAGTNSSSRTYALTDDERQGLRTLFGSVDGDGSGSVDLHELRTFLDFLAKGDGDESLTRAMEGDRPQRPGDRDDDDDEKTTPSAPANDDERLLTPLQLLFNTEDRDGDGRLSSDEFESALVAWSAELGGGGSRSGGGEGEYGDAGNEAEEDAFWREILRAGAARGRQERESTLGGDDGDEGRRRGERTGQGGGGGPPSRRYSRHPPSNVPSNRPSMGPRAPPWKDYVETHGLGVPEKDAERGRRRRRRWGNYGEFDDEWTAADQWELAVASPQCVLCVTGHPANCGPPSPPGCEDPEFQRIGLAAKEAREHAMLIGGFLRKHGITHE